ncbi:zinc ABC transporter substrate-binding protein [Acetobacterium paludosum]|uniref:Zinc ABC transporter substrate-binding protein n=1 Tax=Acetobacterium paludosum TaxID=52693 RepID=A0A923KWM2_9FIRM|nr:metal ABC transporter substrate-binding protein [Acetobacterium paludosum]MBC3888213.1 zinc ABC transporter substrate-binding protein [Acetobacterium paludosum]
MKKLYKTLLLLLAVVLTITAFSACSEKEAQTKTDNGKINVVATIFPEYDFLRQIAGDHINLTMLLKPGAESHSYEPTPQDILNVQNADMFVYVGGDSDAWVSSILDSMDKSKMKIVTLMDCVNLVKEETVEGMEPEATEATATDETEMDEHVWTSPKNSILIVQKLCDELCTVDPDNAGSYKINTENYINKLKHLDNEFQDVVDHAARKEIVVGDRFPFRYFVDDYGLTYYAAFPGCSTDTEASAATVAFLIDKVKTDQIPVVFHIELSNEQMCDSICTATGAKKELLNAVHNVSKDDFDAGVTYLDLMEHNVEVLKEALN